MRNQKIKFKKVVVPVIDRETKLQCVKLVALLEAIQEISDSLEGVSIIKGSLKKATKEMKAAIEPIISQWYKENITDAEGQIAFGTAGKNLEDAIKAIVLMNIGLWQYVPDMVAEHKTLPEIQKEEATAMIKLFFLSHKDLGISVEVQNYMVALIENAMHDYLANPAHETPAQIASRVFDYYFYKMRSLPVGKINYADKFGDWFKNFSPSL